MLIVQYRYIFSFVLACVVLACASCRENDGSEIADTDASFLKYVDTDPDAGGYPGVFPDDQWGLAFSPPSGTFEDSMNIEIFSREELPEGEIHYTTDGSAPTESSPVYDGSIRITGTTEIHATLFISGDAIAEGSAVYIPRSTDISLDLPIVIVDNFGKGALSDSNRTYVRSVFMAFDAHEGKASISKEADSATHSGIHLRGQSSASFEKKPYRVELRDRRDEDLDWPVLGMPAESDWVLRGPFVDKALIRDAFHYTLGRDIGMEAPRARFCELFTNFDGDAVEADDYQGVYMIVETIKNAKRRLDLKQLRADDKDSGDISGGYIFKFEWRASEDPILDCPGNSNCWNELEIVDPTEINEAQSQWLSDHLYAFNQSLRTTSLNDADDGYEQFINVESFVDQIIMNEIGREADAYIRSAFFYKDRDDIIHAGPLWDYNLSLGTGFNLMGLENLSTGGWMYEMNNTRDSPSNDWFFQLMADPAFQERLKARWRELRDGEMSNDALNARINSLAAPLKNAAERNFLKWKNLGDTRISLFTAPATDTWEEQVEALRDWLMARVEWIDSKWR